MCNLKRLPIKSVSPNGIKSAFIPCGECLECRLVQQFGWIARIRFAHQALVNQYGDVNVCMFTLTYRDSRLPHIPKHLVKAKYKSLYDKTPACFNKLHIRSLVRKIRNWLYDVYHIKQPVYMVCSEYGEHTQRPHYHGVVCVPAFVDCCYLHTLIKEFWTRHYGFICPNEFEGSAEFNIKPFVAEVPIKAISYCAKYCCKDIAYSAKVNRFHFERKHLKEPDVSDKNVVRLLDYMPFHFQSRSLGKVFLDGLTDEQKFLYLKRGCSFVGETKLHALPKYYKDRILFDNDYKVVQGKRLCRRRPTKFFKEHYLEIYQQKREAIEDTITKWRKFSYWIDLGCIDSDYRQIENAFDKFRSLSTREMADCYLTYYGRESGRCYTNVSFEDQWFARYFEDDLFWGYKCEPCDPAFLWDLSNLFTTCHIVENHLLEPLKAKELEEDLQNKKLREIVIGH